MEEPNLNYIDDLSQGDVIFKNEIISVLKIEFPEEKKAYLEHFKNSNYALAASTVHKLRHKISILGLQSGYRVAARYEEELKNNEFSNKIGFEKVLLTIENFLNNLK